MPHLIENFDINKQFQLSFPLLLSLFTVTINQTQGDCFAGLS